jgi:lipoyl(octanoyl) transferase
MAAAIGAVLARRGVEARWRRDCPGLWIGSDKICAFGVHVSRRVSIHGFALNVDPDLSAFRSIVSCGLRDAGVTSIDRLKPPAPTVDALAYEVAAAIADSYDIDLRKVDATTIAKSRSAPVE